MSTIKPKNIHVVPRDGQWLVKNEGENRFLSSYKTQRDAIVHAKKLARQEKGELIIHRKDGRIRDIERYSSDPLPPEYDRVVLYPVTNTTGSKVALRKAVEGTITYTQDPK